MGSGFTDGVGKQLNRHGYADETTGKRSRPMSRVLAERRQ